MENTERRKPLLIERLDVSGYISSFGKSYGTYGIVVAAIIAMIIPLLLSSIFMGKKRGKKRSPNWSGWWSMLCCAQCSNYWVGLGSLGRGHNNGCILKQCCKKYSRDQFNGTRKLIKKDFVTISDGRKFERVHLGDYEWQTYGEVYHYVYNFASGLVNFGHNTNARAAIFWKLVQSG